MAALAVVGLQACHNHDHAGHSHDHAEVHEGHDHSGHNHSGHNHSGHDHGHDHAAELAEAASKGHSDEVVFEKARQERFGVKTEVVEASVFSPAVHVGGQVLPAQDDAFAVIAPISGAVTLASDLTVGAYLPAGSVVARVSTAAVAGDGRAVQLKAAYETAKARYERDAELVKDKIISVSQFEQTRLEYVTAKAEYEAIRNSGDGSVEVKTSAPGYVMSVDALSGQYVEAGASVASLAKSRTLMLRAELPERYAATAPVVDDANFSVPSGEIFSVKAMGGRVVARSVNAVDGYLALSFEFPYCSGVVPGAFAEVWLKCTPKDGVIALPLAALVEDQGIYSVFVQLDEDCFMKREVRCGGDNGCMVEILSGLAPGERVVTEGAMHIKLASVSAVPSGHNHSH